MLGNREPQLREGGMRLSRKDTSARRSRGPAGATRVPAMGLSSVRSGRYIEVRKCTVSLSLLRGS